VRRSSPSSVLSQHHLWLTWVSDLPHRARMRAKRSSRPRPSRLLVCCQNCALPPTIELNGCDDAEHRATLAALADLERLVPKGTGIWPLRSPVLAAGLFSIRRARRRPGAQRIGCRMMERLFAHTAILGEPVALARKLRERSPDLARGRSSQRGHCFPSRLRRWTWRGPRPPSRGARARPPPARSDSRSQRWPPPFPRDPLAPSHSGRQARRDAREFEQATALSYDEREFAHQLAFASLRRVSGPEKSRSIRAGKGQGLGGLNRCLSSACMSGQAAPSRSGAAPPRGRAAPPAFRTDLAIVSVSAPALRHATAPMSPFLSRSHGDSRVVPPL
jgi:hypothetical protein